MAQAAAKFADHLIITSDNPRNEDPEAIIADILEGLAGNDISREVVIERREAIFHAVQTAKAGDVIVLAGKGHEDYQEIRGRKLPFLDADHAALALASRATMRGI